MLASVLLAQYVVIWSPLGSTSTIELWEERGYVLAWGMGAAIALLGDVVAIIMRPTWTMVDDDGDRSAAQ